MVGRAVRIAVENFIWDYDIEAHLARHWVEFEDLMSVARGDYLAFENLPKRGGTNILIGRDRNGRVLYVSIKPTSIPGLWEPVTAWESRVARRIWARERGDDR